MRVNIIPVHEFSAQVDEHWAMDWNDLMYNIGGTIGMWLGVSMITVPNIVLWAVMIMVKLIYSIKLCWFSINAYVCKK